MGAEISWEDMTPGTADEVVLELVAEVMLMVLRCDHEF